MRKKAIPVKQFRDKNTAGIVIEKMQLNDLRSFKEEIVNSYEEQGQAHRHDRHSFYLLEKGVVSMEIDFQKHNIKAPAVIYIHPNQVHRILAFKEVSVTCLAMRNENLNPEYLKRMEDITPANPLKVKKENFALLSEAAALCIKLCERKGDKLYHSFLKDSCNAVVALAVSFYTAQTKSTDKLSRFEMITKAFKVHLERNYTRLKRPAAYAQILNISTPYLNECVKNVTGFPVSHHIQQRVILEAKRLLYHSNKSVKEIAGELGYDDYPYFSRLFTKVTGMTALTFRSKNRD